MLPVICFLLPATCICSYKLTAFSSLLIAHCSLRTATGNHYANEPIIQHGIVTTSISLREVVRAINKCAFPPRTYTDQNGNARVVPGDEEAHGTSPYPLIISLENHCSYEQELVMAKIFVEELGDKLAIPAQMEAGWLADKKTGRHDTRYPPSPEQLMYKVIIKAKVLGVGKVEEAGGAQNEGGAADAGMEDGR